MKNKEVEENHREMEKGVRKELERMQKEKGISGYKKEEYKITAIGYLDESEPYKKGEVSSSFLLKLDVLWNKGTVLASMGYHECDFCEKERAKGSSEKILIDKVNKIKYIFPELIFHYCKKHEFKPSNEFIEFVMRE